MCDINLKSLLYYFILIPFIRPQGFEIYFVYYKRFFVIWLYASMFCIIAYLIKSRLQLKYATIAVLVYYVVFIGLSFFIQKGIDEGLQKVFAAPALILICSVFMKEDKQRFIRCMTNSLLILFILNLFIFNPIFFDSYFNYDKHLVFLGHVQVCSQFGLLGVFVSVIADKFHINSNKKNKLLLVLSIVTMAISTTLASYVTILFLLLGYFYYKKSKRCLLLIYKSQVYFIAYFLVNLFVFVILYINKWRNPFDYIDINGRDFIWEQCYALFRESPIIGYGVHGVKIHVFWNEWKVNHPGFNYAHNQIWQILIDGGVLLLVIFAIFMTMYMSEINKIKNKEVKVIANLTMIIVLIIMSFESVFEYNYLLVILSMISYLSKYDLEVLTIKKGN